MWRGRGDVGVCVGLGKVLGFLCGKAMDIGEG